MDNKFYEELLKAMGPMNGMVAGHFPIRILDIIPLESRDTSLQRSEKIKAWAMTYWPKGGTSQASDTLLFLVPAFNLDEAIKNVAGAFPIDGKPLADFVLRKWVFLDYDLLFPGMVRPEMDRAAIDKIAFAIREHIQENVPAARVADHGSKEFIPKEILGYSIADLEKIVEFWKIHQGGDLIESKAKQFVYQLKLVLDKTKPTAEEKAVVGRLVERLEKIYVH